MRVLNFLLCLAAGLSLSNTPSVSQVIDQFELPVAGERPNHMITGPNGAVWYTLVLTSKIGRITAEGEITEYVTPGPLNSLTLGPDGNIWGGLTDGLLRITPDGSTTEFPSPFNAGLTTQNSSERIIDVTAGPDGNLWAVSTSADEENHAVSKVTPNGEYTVYNILQNFGTPKVIAAGSDGRLWFISNSISRYGTITTDGEDITISSTPSDLSFEGLLSTIGIVAGPDGNLWFTDANTRVVVRFAPDGIATRFKIPSLDGKPQNLVAGPHGSLWVTLSGTNKIVRVTTSGIVTEFDLPAGTSTFGIALASDDNLWIGQTQGSADIIVFTPPEPGVRVGAVQSSSNASGQSYVRLYNNGTEDSSASITLHNAETGQPLGTWSSPPIGANQARQFTLETLETAALPDDLNARAELYTLSVNQGFNGLFQHIRWSSASGTLTNLSTCASGSTVPPKNVAFVHTSLLNDNYPSTIIAHNTGRMATPVSLDIYDARDGSLLGTFDSDPIPSNGQAIINISQIESAANLVPEAGLFHYIVNVGNAFSGFLQHLVENRAVDALADMTPACAVGTARPQSVPHIAEFAMPEGDAAPGKILSGPDGELFVRMSGADVASVSLDGAINMSALPTADLITDGAIPSYEIELGPDKEVWYATSSRMGRLDESGTFDSFDLPETEIATTPVMTPSSNDEMWYTPFFSNKISRATQAGEITAFDIPGLEGTSLFTIVQSRILAMATGTDGQAYFTLDVPGQLGRVNNDGVVQVLDIPEPYAVFRGIEAGPQPSTMWFTTQNPAALGRLEVDDTITMFPLPNLNASPGSLTQGLDGNMWFTLGNTNEIGRMKADGAFTAYPIPTADSGISGITLGDDGNIWFTERTARKVGRLSRQINGIASSGVYSSAQQASLSYLRFSNGTVDAQSVTLTLSDFETGVSLGTWTSASIPGNSAVQIPISEIEGELGLSAPFANRYSVNISHGFEGTYQHVVWRATTGTLTNLTSCSETRPDKYSRVNYVHSSRVNANYPSQLILLNDSALDETVRLELYDARDGSLLGTTESYAITSYGQLSLSIATLEQELDLQPDENLFHYVVVNAEAPSVTLQHLVDNELVNVTTDMTTACNLH